METRDALKNELKEQVSVSDFSFTSNKSYYFSSILILLLWVTFCWEGISSVVQVWYGNEIFNHGFFIVPGSLYLIYLKRNVVLSHKLTPSPLALIVIVPSFFLYIVGVAGDVQLFMHLATFSLLPALIWFMVGDKAAVSILFPLCFMLFSVPVGEQLIPYLQEIAADGSVMLLQLTGVPLFRSGLYIEIPQGRFLVAEACSGVSFFIASFVIGSLYAYLNLVSTKRKLLFLFVSLLFPVIANIVRVYGIILIAYWTDMEYAAGADHLIYGWFFFAFVIVCLLGIGELLHKTDKRELKEKIYCKKGIEHSFLLCVSLVTVMLMAHTWLYLIDNRTLPVSAQQSTFSIALPLCEATSFDLSPVFNNPTNRKEEHFVGANNSCNISFYEAQFDGVNNELVSELNRIYNPELWSLVNDRNEEIWIESIALNLRVNYLSSPNGQIIKVVHWLSVGERHFNSKVNAKLYEIRQALEGNREMGTIAIVVVPQNYDFSELGSKIKSLK